MLTAAVTSGLPHPPKLSFSRGEDHKYLRALDKIYVRRTMSVLVKAKHY